MDEPIDVVARDVESGTRTDNRPLGPAGTPRQRTDPLPIGIVAAGALVGAAVWLGLILFNAAWVISTGDWIDHAGLVWPRREPEEAALIAAGVTILAGGIAAAVGRVRAKSWRRR